MEKSQYNLCVEVLKRLDSADILKDIVIVGSWCGLFYKDYFDKESAIRIFSALIEKGQGDLIREVYNGMPRRWKGMIKRQLTEFTDRDILALLESKSLP